MNGVHVGAAIEQKFYNARRSANHRAVQRRPARTVAEVHERRIGVDQRTNARDVTTLGRGVDGVIGPCLRRLDRHSIESANATSVRSVTCEAVTI